MPTLEPMTDAAFERYLELAITDYASEGARATGMEPHAALERARSQIAALLPDGNHTVGQHFRSLRTTGGDEVGIVWYAEQLEDALLSVFLYDIRISEDRRGEGLGTAAMTLLHDEVRSRGAVEIKLHVFSHNTGAVRLYEQLGYRTLHEGQGGAQMAKRL